MSGNGKLLIAMSLNIILASLITGLFYVVTEPYERKSIGGALIPLNLTYSGRLILGFIFGVLEGGFFGLVLSCPLLFVKEKRFLLLVSAGSIFGVLFFLAYYGYYSSEIARIHTQLSARALLTQQLYDEVIHVIPLCFVIAVITYFVKNKILE